MPFLCKGFATGVPSGKPLVIRNANNNVAFASASLDDCKVYFHEVFGSQEYKRKYLSGKSIFSEKLIKLKDDEKYHWFTKVKSNKKYFNEFIGLHEIFNIINSGIETKRDKLFIDFDKNKLKERMIKINNFDFDENFKNEYKAYSSDGYDFEKKIKTIDFNKNDIKIIHYRPFDFRYICFNEWLARTRMKTNAHIIDKENIGLIFPRQIAGGYGFQHGLVSEYIIDRATGEAKTGSETYFAPLYLYEENSAGEFNLENQLKPNWTNSFNEFLKNYISKNPREILNYIYAILLSPTYRENYKEDLKYDFPRIPFTKNKNIFKKLQNIGNELIDLHLLKKIPNTKAGYPIIGKHKIDYLKYDEERGRLYINEKQYFENIKKEVYNYSIGGYNPLEKYIKARKILTLADIKHLIKIIAIIEKTILLQEETIDYLTDL